MITFKSTSSDGQVRIKLTEKITNEKGRVQDQFLFDINYFTNKQNAKKRAVACAYKHFINEED